MAIARRQKAEAPAPPRLPVPEDFAEYAAAVEKLKELQAEYDSLNEEHDSLETLLLGEHRENPLMAAALRKLDGMDDQTAAQQARLKEVREELEVNVHARRIQQDRITAALEAVSDQACEMAAGQHAALLLRIVNAVVELQAAVAAERALVHEMRHFRPRGTIAKARGIYPGGHYSNAWGPAINPGLFEPFLAAFAKNFPELAGKVKAAA
jgi:uncharacterized protein YdcH (DUF465 family)